MADTYQTLADLVKINDQNLADIDVSDLLNRAPLLAALAAAESSNGTKHSYVKETEAPVVGFRSPNTGLENSVSKDENVSIDLKILDASFAVDQAIADAYGKGPESYILREALRHLRAAYFEAEKQFLYGTDNASDGFTGISQASTILYKNSDIVVDATGTSANATTDVFAIVTSSDETEVTAITGNGGNIEIKDTVEQRITDGDGKHYPGYYTSIQGWLGLQVGSKWSVGRICNLTAQSGKGLTDTLLSQLMEKMPRTPSMFVMTRQSRGQLQRSRTTYSPTGAPAPIPQEYEGVPIVVLESMTNTRPVLAASA